MPHIEIDQATDDYLAFASKVAGINKGEVVAQLIVIAKSDIGSVEMNGPTKPDAVSIHADYEGHRTGARFYRGPGRIEVVEGPLAGQEFKTPSEAARAVVSHYNPNVSASRNGWTFWLLSETGAPLQTIRYEDI